MNATRLHLAAFDGDDNTLNQLLNEGADVNSVTNEGETPLRLAAMKGHSGIVRSLLKWGADVNYLPPGTSSPLRVAVGRGHADIVALLLAKGADPEAVAAPKPVSPEEQAKAREDVQKMLQEFGRMVSSLGVSGSPFKDIPGRDANPTKKEGEPFGSGKFHCLAQAVMSGSLETVKVLLEAGYSPNPELDWQKTSLFDLCRMLPNKLEMARLLLQYGADPNGLGTSGLSPLGAAIVFGDIPFAELLLEAGARTDKGAEGMGLLTSALSFKNTEMIRFLVDRNIGVNDPMVDVFLQDEENSEIKGLISEKRGIAWLAQVESSDIAGVQAALQNGADVNKAGKEGTALHLAAKANNAPMVRLLLEAGADHELAKTYEMVPLHTAARNGATEVCKILLEHGIDVNTKTKFGQTPLYYAAVGQHFETADLLIAQGASLTISEAILLRRDEVVKDFWASGTSVNTKTEAGMTPLIAAVMIQDKDLVASLLARGAEVDAVDNWDRTALCYAGTLVDTGIAELLLENGANPDVETDQSALKMAVQNRNEPMMRLLLERGATLEQPIRKRSLEHISQRPLEEEAKREVWKDLKEKEQLLYDVLMIHRFMIDTDFKNAHETWHDLEKLWAVIRTLVEFGADVNTVDMDGNPFLCCLIEFGAPLDLIREVIAKGAFLGEPNDPLIGTIARKRFDKAPLMVAIAQKRADVVEVLLQNGVNPNEGLTVEGPLEFARQSNQEAIAELLIAFGASDEKRAEKIAELGDTAPFRLRSMTDNIDFLNNRMPILDFGHMRLARQEGQDKRMIQRWAQLIAEVEEAEKGNPPTSSPIPE